MKKLLVTARDAGAAFNIIEICKQALSEGIFSLEIYAQMPAAQYFQENGIVVNVVSLPSAKTTNDEEAKNLLCYCKALIENIRPDAILSGLSTPFDGGIDEAILAVAKGKIPTIVMQDFWGEANKFFGVIADCYLSLDAEAVRITYERHNAISVALGSPRHAHIGKIPLLKFRNMLRKELEIDQNALVIGLFGQALHRLEGYYATIQYWSSSLKHFSKKIVAVYRSHPREKEEETFKTIELIKETGLECKRIQHEKVEHSLLMCDVVCSAFSNCSYDASYINYYAIEPLLVPMLLLFNEEVSQYLRSKVCLEQFPYLKDGMALAVNRPEELEEKLNYAISKKGKKDIWLACKQLPDPCRASSRALEVILEEIDKKVLLEYC